jgi:hypothetical protein
MSQAKIVLDPGTHLFTLSRQGFADVVISKSFAPKTKTTLALAAENLPAVLHVTSNAEGAAVALNGVDVGLAPVDLVRPRGSYKVVVAKDGFVTYATQSAAPSVHFGE